VKYTASVFANYTFTDDVLKGFSVGGGLAYTGKSYAATYDKQEYYGSKVRNSSLVLAYETKFRSIPTRIALNVDNVLGDEDPIVTSYHWGYVDSAGTHIKDGYYLPAPRSFRLSVQLTF
jgi:hypothetical protein